jgi:hypothetical protein
VNPTLILEIGTLIAQLGPLGLELFTKLEGLLNLGPDVNANIANAIAAANTADADTISKVSAWMLTNGFKAQTVFVKPSAGVAVAASTPPS